jgi:hypothetical protein
MAGPDGALVRGAHWRNFLVKYPAANRAHKKMLALSALCRERGDPPDVRRAIGRAQCNDAYWHGVFGGLYLPHLRAAIWHNLALAERDLRAGEELAWEARDMDGDGYDEIWVHSAGCSVVVAPSRGGAVEDLTLFATLTNHTATLTRRREAYHELGVHRPSDPASDDQGKPGEHDAEHAPHFDGRPRISPSRSTSRATTRSRQAGRGCGCGGRHRGRQTGWSFGWRGRAVRVRSPRRSAFDGTADWPSAIT